MAIKIGLDVTDVTANGKLFIDSLRGQGIQVKELASGMALLNEKGYATGLVLKGTTVEGNKFSAIFKEANSTLELTKVKLTKVNEELLNERKIVAQNAIEGEKAANRFLKDLERKTAAQKKFDDAAQLALVRAKDRIAKGEQQILDKAAKEKEREANRKERQDKTDRFREQLTISPAGIARLAQSQVIRRGVRFALDEVGTSVKNARDLSIEIGKLQAITDGANTSSDQWRGTLTRLSTAFGISQIEAAQVAYAGVEAGIYKAGQSTKGLEEGLKLSKITTLSSSESVELLSNVMNSYKISSEGAGKVTSILSDLLSQTDGKASQFATQFTEIAASASATGVSLVELTAVIETLRKNGISSKDATAILSSAFEQLKKPGKELQEVFKELGISTSQELIQLKGGFENTLVFMGGLAKKTKGDITSFGSEFEILNQKITIGNGALDGFGESLRHVSSLTNEADKKFKIISETAGQKLNVELAKVQAYFVNGLGTTFIEDLNYMNQNLVSLTTTVEVLVPLVTAATTVFLLFKSYAIIEPAIIASYASLQNLIKGVTVAETEATVASTGLIGKVGLLAVAFTAAYAAGNYLFNGYDDTTKLQTDAAEKVKAEMEKLKTLNQQSISAQETQEKDQTENIQKQYDKRYQLLEDFGTKLYAKLQQGKEEELKTLRELNEGIKVQSSGVLSGIRKSISDLESEANKAKNAIEESKKSVDSLQNKSEVSVFNSKLKYAGAGHVDSLANINADQQSPLLQSQIKSLSKKESDFAAKGTEEGIQQARKISEEREKLQIQLSEHQTNLDFEVFKQRVKLGQQGPTSYNTDGSPRYEFTVNTRKEEEKIKGIREQLIAEETAFQAVKEEQQKKDLAAAESLKKKLVEARLLFDDAIKFSPINDKGEIKEKYKGLDKNGKPNAIKAQTDEREIDQKAINALPEGPDKTQLIVALSKKEVENKKILIAELQRLQVKADNDSLFQRHKTEKEELDSLTKSREDLKAKQLTDIKDLKEKTEITSNAGRATDIELFGRAVEGIRERIPGNTLDKGTVKLQEAILTANASKEKYENAISEFTKARLSGKSSDAELAKLASTVKETNHEHLIREAKVQELSAGNPTQTRLPGDTGTETASNRFRRAESAGETLANDTERLGEVNAKIQAMTAGLAPLDEAIKSLPNGFIETSVSVTKARSEVTDFTIDTRRNIKDITQDLDNMNSAFEKQHPALQPDNPNTKPKDNLFGGLRYFRDGYAARGSDNIPAMLSRGESVITAEASEQWAPVIQAMNSGVLSNKATGSSQIANFGDITVNVDGSQTPVKTGQEVAKSLRRLVRRGMAKLG